MPGTAWISGRLVCVTVTIPDENPLEVAQTVFWVNRVFVPCQKGAVLTKQRDEFCIQTLETDENGKHCGYHSGKGMV